MACRKSLLLALSIMQTFPFSQSFVVGLPTWIPSNSSSTFTTSVELPSLRFLYWFSVPLLHHIFKLMAGVNSDIEFNVWLVSQENPYLHQTYINKRVGSGGEKNMSGSLQRSLQSRQSFIVRLRSNIYKSSQTIEYRRSVCTVCARGYQIQPNSSEKSIQQCAADSKLHLTNPTAYSILRLFQFLRSGFFWQSERIVSPEGYQYRSLTAILIWISGVVQGRRIGNETHCDPLPPRPKGPQKILFEDTVIHAHRNQNNGISVGGGVGYSPNPNAVLGSLCILPKGSFKSIAVCRTIPPASSLIFLLTSAFTNALLLVGDVEPVDSRRSLIRILLSGW